MLRELSRNHVKSILRTSKRDSHESMSIKKNNYSEIFKNNVYNNRREILPPFSRNKSNNNLPKSVKSNIVINNESLVFPNTDITLDITTSTDK
jgi:hypothetical protein